jgi:GT2 family glycosyltransferase
MDLLAPQHTPNLADDVGVVVIGRNEGERLINCLKSVAPETITTVYVDSGSADDSVVTARRLGATVVELNMALPFTAARARNEGFAALKALRSDIEFVQFVDGDCALDAGWLPAALDFVSGRSNVAVVCGRLRERHPELSIYNWLCDVEWDTPIGETSACGGIAMVRTQAFEAVGGFTSQLIAGEEPELCLRLRQSDWKIWRLAAEMARHDAAISHFSQWWRRAVRSGYAYANVLQLHARSSTAIWKKEVGRAVFWAGAVPVMTLLAALVKPVAIALFLIYPLQIVRISLRQGAFTRRSWYYAFFMTLSKFAEFEGILKYLWVRWVQKPIALIEYK